MLSGPIFRPSMRQKITTTYLLFLILLSTSDCGSYSGEKPGSTTIKGKIQFPPGEKIYCYSYTDSLDLLLDRKLPIDSAIIDKDGNFSLNPPFKNAWSFDLRCGKNYLVNNLILLPGSSLKINFFGKENKPEIFPSGDAENFNNFLLRLSKDFYQDADPKNVYYIATNYMDINQFSEYNKTRKENMMNLFNNMFQGKTLNKDFYNYAVNTINYGIAIDRLMYLWKKRMKRQPVTPDSSYLDFETPSFVDNKEALNCPSYNRFLYLYIKDVYEDKVEKGELPESGSGKLIPQVEKYKLAMKLLTRPCLDVVMYNIILSDTPDSARAPAEKLPLDSLMASFRQKYSMPDAPVQGD